MSTILVDSNILLDLLTRDAVWYEWSSDAIGELGDRNVLAINPVIYSEVSVHFSTIEALDVAFPGAMFRREPIPFEAAFLAGRIFGQYKKRGGSRLAPLPDFFIGAHAAVAGYTLLTRNARDYRRDFPKLTLIAP